MLESLQQFLPLIVLVLGAPLVLWLTLLAKRGLNKLGLQETAALEALVTMVVNQAVLYAEQEASKAAAAGEEAGAGTKLQLALDFIKLQLVALGLAEMARDELIRRIEASVGELNSVIA
jgi:hypothetical protein